MQAGRLSVRLHPVYQDWIRSLGGDESHAARALLVLGAAALGLEGAEREALRLAGADLPAAVLLALRDVSDKCPTTVRQVSDTAVPDPVLPPDDPFASLGFDV